MAVTKHRGADGRLHYRVTYRAEGKQHSGGTFPTEKEAQHEYGALMRRVARGERPWEKSTDIYGDTRRGKQTVAGYAAAWLPGHRLQAHSRESYERVLRVHILPAIGSMALRDVTPADVRTWFRRLEDAGKSGALRRKIKTVAQAMFTAAMLDGNVPSNPVRDVPIKVESPPRRKAMTREQFARLWMRLPATTACC